MLSGKAFFGMLILMLLVFFACDEWVGEVRPIVGGCIVLISWFLAKIADRTFLKKA